MHADTREPDISAALVPHLGALSDEAKVGWRPQIRCKTLREEIFGNAKIAEDLRRDVLTFFHASSAQPDPEIASVRRFRYLLTQDIAVVQRRCGLVSHVHQIADLIAKGCDSADPLRWPLEDLRFTLGMRRDVKACPEWVNDLDAAVANSGAACLSAWLNDLPDTITSVLAIAAGPLGDSLRLRVEAPEQVQICDACLARVEDG